jgi:hypothetical protein
MRSAQIRNKAQAGARVGRAQFDDDHIRHRLAHQGVHRIKLVAFETIGHARGKLGLPVDGCCACFGDQGNHGATDPRIQMGVGQNRTEPVGAAALQMQIFLVAGGAQQAADAGL